MLVQSTNIGDTTSFHYLFHRLFCFSSLTMLSPSYLHHLCTFIFLIFNFSFLIFLCTLVCCTLFCTLLFCALLFIFQFLLHFPIPFPPSSILPSHPFPLSFTPCSSLSPHLHPFLSSLPRTHQHTHKHIHIHIHMHTHRPLEVGDEDESSRPFISQSVRTNLPLGAGTDEDDQLDHDDLEGK